MKPRVASEDRGEACGFGDYPMVPCIMQGMFAGIFHFVFTVEKNQGLI